MNVEFTLQDAGSYVNYKQPCVTSDNLRRKSSYRCLRASNAVFPDTVFMWVSFTCPSYLCAALTCICSYQSGGDCNNQAFICATSSVIDRISNS